MDGRLQNLLLQLSPCAAAPARLLSSPHALSAPEKQKREPMLEAGAAQIEITPAVGVDLTGMDDGPSTGFNDPLWVKALVFRGRAGGLVVIVTLDLLGIELRTTRQVRRRISRRLPGVGSPGRYRHSDTSHTTLYISLVILYTKYTEWHQNDFNAYA